MIEKELKVKSRLLGVNIPTPLNLGHLNLHRIQLKGWLLGGFIPNQVNF